jgi:hypothetical protein
MTDTALVLPEGAAPLAEAEPTLEPDETGAAPAFDASVYRLNIPEVDGVDAENIVITFGGQVELDMTDEKQLGFFNDLKLGKEVELRVAGFIGDKSSPIKDKDGIKTMTRKAKVVVTDVYLLSPADL